MADIVPIDADNNFVIRIIATILRSDWLVRYGTVLVPEHMPSKEGQEAIKWINAYWIKYRTVPTENNVRYALHNTDIVQAAYDADEEGLEYVADVVMEFVQTQAMKLAILASSEDIAKGDLHKPIERVKEALRIGTDKTDLGLDLVSDANEWIYDELHGRRFPTGWRDIDRSLDGGIVPGEYWLVMAPPNKGKTTMLVNIGYAIAGLLGCGNVLHMTFEMPRTKVLKRYGARVAGTRVSRDGNKSEKDFRRELELRARQRLRGHLRVISPRPTFDAIRSSIDLLAAEGFHTDALIIDYPDLVTPIRRRNDKRLELADNARESKQLAIDYNMPVIGATQSGRQSFNKEIIRQSDIAEAIEKAAIADGIWSLCQTLDEEKLGQGRIYVAKARDSEYGLIVPVKIDFKNQSILQRLV